jgi:hypothetical protein
MEKTNGDEEGRLVGEWLDASAAYGRTLTLECAHTGGDAERKDALCESTQAARQKAEQSRMALRNYRASHGH